MSCDKKSAWRSIASDCEAPKLFHGFMLPIEIDAAIAGYPRL